MFRHYKPFIAILLLTSIAYSAAPTKPVARILALKGSVLIKAADGRARAAAVYGTVFEGETLTVKDTAELTLVFRNDGHSELLKKPVVFTVGSTGCEPRGQVEAIAKDARRQALIAKGLQRLPELALAGAVSVPRSGPAEKISPAINPINGATQLTQRPVLSWPAVENATMYEIVVFNGTLRHWATTTNKVKLEYQGPVLKPSRTYRWEIVAKLSGQVLPVGKGEFTIATAEQVAEAQEIKELAIGEDVVALALAALNYERLGLFAEALDVYERLAKLAPDTSPFHAALADLYEKAGRREDSTQARVRAEKLGFEFQKSVT